MSYTSIAAALVTILGNISSNNVVYDHEPKELLKFPAITVTAAGHDNAFGDTASNKRKFSFNIRGYYRTDQVDDAETALRSLADDIISAIEANTTLNGVCDFATPSKGRFTNPPKEVPVQAIEITIDAIKRVAR